MLSIRFENNEAAIQEEPTPAVPDADIWARFRNLYATLPPAELRGALDTRYLQPLLYFLARTIHARTIVEIGAGLAGSFLPLLKVAAEMDGVLISIDPDAAALARETEIARRYGLTGIYSPQCVTSDAFFASRVPQFSIDFAFVDGLHSSAGVRNDARNVLNRLVPGGIAVFHEYDTPNIPPWEQIRSIQDYDHGGIDYGTPRALRDVLTEFDVDTMPLDFGACGKDRVPVWTEAGAIMVRKRRTDEFQVK